MPAESARGGCRSTPASRLLAGGESGRGGRGQERRKPAGGAGRGAGARHHHAGPRTTTVRRANRPAAGLDRSGFSLGGRIFVQEVRSAPLEPRRWRCRRRRQGRVRPIRSICCWRRILPRRPFNVPGLVDDRTFLAASMSGPGRLVANAGGSRRVPKRQLAGQALAGRGRTAGDKQQYATHWLTFWNDALRNDYRGTGYIDGGRLQITDWLAAALVENMPYDEFVRQLIDPTRPIRRGSSRASCGAAWSTPARCRRCRRRRTSRRFSWASTSSAPRATTASSATGSSPTPMAWRAFFPTARWRCIAAISRPGNSPRCSFSIPIWARSIRRPPSAERLKQLAEVITRPENGRLARTIVNRLWARLLGRGLVEPVDEMDNPPGTPTCSTFWPGSGRAWL